MEENVEKWCFRNYPEIEAWDELPDGVSVLDTHFSIVDANRTMKHWYSRDSFPRGEKCYRIYHHRQKPCPWCPTRLTLSCGKARSGIVPYHGKRGEIRGWQKLIVFPIFDQEGNIVGVMEYVQDITAVKSLEEEIQSYQIKLRALEKKVELLNALLEKARQAEEKWRESWVFMAHHMVKPVLQSLREDLKDQPQQEYLQVIETFLSRMEEDIIAVKNRRSPFFALLTPRELQVALLVAQGKSSKEIAAELSLSMKAVEFYRGEIRKKLGIRNTRVNLQSYLLTHVQPGAFPGDFQV
ncbi:MAG: LuxR C-terminal-related transcriptional regulator [Candidatus Caldatribacteriaceae bacterium]